MQVLAQTIPHMIMTMMIYGTMTHMIMTMMIYGTMTHMTATLIMMILILQQIVLVIHTAMI